MGAVRQAEAAAISPVEETLKKSRRVILFMINPLTRQKHSSVILPEKIKYIKGIPKDSHRSCVPQLLLRSETP